MQMTEKRKGQLYTLAEEIANAVSHGVGVLFGIAATVFLIVMAVKAQNRLAIAGFAVYGIFLTLMYLMSTLYHGITHPGAKKILRVADHCAIYLMIAGSYFPIALLALNGLERVVTLSVIFSIAAAGIVFKILTYGKYDRFGKLSVWIYVLMGWICVFTLRSIYNATSLAFLLWLGAGGLVYTLGVIFYKAKRIPFNHAIWHGFVLLASALQFVGIAMEFAL
jgi:hemolysin III